jgi:hypothetical protein
MPKTEVHTTPQALTGSPLSDHDASQSFEDSELVSASTRGSETAYLHSDVTEREGGYEVFCCGNSIEDLAIIAGCFIGIYTFVAGYYVFLLTLVLDSSFDALYSFFFVFCLAVGLMSTVIMFGANGPCRSKPPTEECVAMEEAAGPSDEDIKEEGSL